MSIRLLQVMLLTAMVCCVAVGARRLSHSSKLQSMLEVRNEPQTEEEVEAALDNLLLSLGYYPNQIQVQGETFLTPQQLNELFGPAPVPAAVAAAASQAQAQAQLQANGAYAANGAKALSGAGSRQIQAATQQLRQAQAVAKAQGQAQAQFAKDAPSRGVEYNSNPFRGPQYPANGPPAGSGQPALAAAKVAARAQTQAQFAKDAPGRDVGYSLSPYGAPNANGVAPRSIQEVALAKAAFLAQHLTRQSQAAASQRSRVVQNGAPVPPSPMKIGFIEETAATRAVLELESMSEHSTSARVNRFPGGNVGAAGLVPVRQACRSGGGPDPAMPFGGFTYYQDGRGRVTAAYGPVFIRAGARIPNHQDVADYCDVLYDPNGAPNFNARGNAAGGGRNLWQSGHIIGYRLGGVSDDPINFYPQIRTSNNQGGRWGRLEAIALVVKRACLATRVMIGVRFLTWTPGLAYQDVKPATGRYTVVASDACFATICVPVAGGNGANPALAFRGVDAHAYLRAFCRHATQAGVAPHWKLQTDFSNDANDRTDQIRDARLLP